MSNAPADVRWTVAPWSELGVDHAYAWLRLRERVFVVEQACPYLDADGRDPLALHLLAWAADLGDAPPWADGHLLAGARILPAGVAHADVAIGRVVTAPEARRTGLGRELMTRALATIGDRWGPVRVHLSAQAYLRRFYEELGFAVDGESYDEDGIPHLPMTGMAPRR